MTGSAGSQSASLSISGGSSFLSPSSINSLSGLLNYNPGNLGPLNPYLSSGYGSFATGTNYNPAYPAQISSGSSSGTNTGMFGYQPNGYSGGQPSGPGSQISGNPANPLSVHTTVAPSTTTALKTTGKNLFVYSFLQRKLKENSFFLTYNESYRFGFEL